MERAVLIGLLVLAGVASLDRIARSENHALENVARVLYCAAHGCMPEPGNIQGAGGAR